MAINKRLIHFKNKEKFKEELANNNILDSSIVFIQDSKEISTHGTVYKTVCWSILEESSSEPEDPVVPPTPDPEEPETEVSNIGNVSASSGININSESLLPGTYELRYIDENDNIIENFDPITTFTI